MNLLSLILIGMAIIVAGCIFYVAWEFSSGKIEGGMKIEPDESKESKDSSGPKAERGAPEASDQQRP